MFWSPPFDDTQVLLVVKLIFKKLLVPTTLNDSQVLSVVKVTLQKVLVPTTLNDSQVS